MQGIVNQPITISFDVLDSTTLYDRAISLQAIHQSILLNQTNLDIDFTRAGEFTFTGYDAELISNLQIYTVNPDYIILHTQRDKNIKYQLT